MPGPIADSSHEDHVLLVGYSVPWLQEATAAQLQCLQDCGFQLPGSRGGAHPGGAEAEVHPGGVKVQVQERVFAAADVTQQVGEEGASEQGPLEWCMWIEGHQAFEKVIQEQKVSCVQGREPREHEQDYVGRADIHEDLQPDSFAEGSLGIGDAQRNRLQGRQFEVQDRNVVRGCLMHLNLAHLIGAVEQLGVEAMEDFLLLFREDLIEAGATKAEAEAILAYANGGEVGSTEGSATTRAQMQRPSRPAAARLHAGVKVVRAQGRRLQGARVPLARARAGAAQAHPKAGAGAAQAHPEAGAGAAQAHPKVGAGAAQAHPKAGAGAAQAHPKAGAGAAQAHPEAGAGAAQAHPKAGAGAAQAHPNTGAGAAQAHPKAGAGTAQACPKASAGEPVQGAQSKAHVEFALADPSGQSSTEGEAGVSPALGTLLGRGRRTPGAAGEHIQGVQGKAHEEGVAADPSGQLSAEGEAGASPALGILLDRGQEQGSLGYSTSLVRSLDQSDVRGDGGMALDLKMRGHPVAGKIGEDTGMSASKYGSSRFDHPDPDPFRV